MQDCENKTAGHVAIVPVPKLENDFYDWYARHEAKARAASAGKHELIFIGDSITHLFEGDANRPNRGERVWQEYYGKRQALNLGFGWDRTQNVLWRLGHGEFAGQTPKLVVLLIGTNNLTGSDNCPASTPAQIVEGIASICRKITTASPATHILLMAVLPRSTAQDPLRAGIQEINQRLMELAKGAAGKSQMTFLDIGAKFLDAKQAIPAALMDDAVHPTEAGYRLWAEAIEPIVRLHLEK